MHDLLRRSGLDVVRYRPSRFPELRRVQLLRANEIDVVLDVGANEGPFAQTLRRAGYRGRIVSLEPQLRAYERLARSAAGDPLWECHRLALGSVDGQAELHVAGNSSSSSLLEMEPSHLASAPQSAYVGVEPVRVARLDSLSGDILRPGERVYLKVDVQGFELEVLRGAAETLPQVALVDIELSLVRLYEGAPLFDEVIEQLDQAGLVPLWLEPVFADPATGRLLQLDGLFGRTT